MNRMEIPDAKPCKETVCKEVLSQVQACASQNKACAARSRPFRRWKEGRGGLQAIARDRDVRSEEHTSELQSPDHLVCRLLLEKKKRSHRTTSQNSLGQEINRVPLPNRGQGVCRAAPARLYAAHAPQARSRTVLNRQARRRRSV